jgi:hypothetical protein
VLKQIYGSVVVSIKVDCRMKPEEYYLTHVIYFAIVRSSLTRGGAVWQLVGLITRRS